jgi:NADH:ubiquinone oxidoreductase subunit 3 (subunit A)
MSILQIGLIILIVISAMYLISFWAISKKGDYEKLSAYENGFNPIGDARKKIDIIYWIIGLLY